MILRRVSGEGTCRGSLCPPQLKRVAFHLRGELRLHPSVALHSEFEVWWVLGDWVLEEVGGDGSAVPESVVAPCVVAVRPGEWGAIEPELECECQSRGAEIAGHTGEQESGVAVHGEDVGEESARGWPP